MPPSFRDYIRRGPFLLDGALGTMIQKLELDETFYGGADFKMLVDILCFSAPDDVMDIHLSFLRAGAQAIETNTFGSSPLRLAEYDFSQLDTHQFPKNPYGIELNTLPLQQVAYFLNLRAAELARAACAQYRCESQFDGRDLFVVGSLGPSNHVVSATTANLRQATFDQIAENFYVQAMGLIDGGVDALLFETQQDILELKAGIFGARRAMKEKKCALPLMAQVTVDPLGRMQLFNTDIHAALVTVQGTGIDAFGINCSIGPDLMEKTVERLTQVSPLPVSVLPNAGLPISEDGKTVFRFAPDRFAALLKQFVQAYRVRVVGGCCGTTPDHIAAVRDALKEVVPKPCSKPKGLYVSGPQKAVLLDSTDGLIRFGERLNIRGSKLVRDAVENNMGINHDILESVVREQVLDLGCPVIDVCMDSNQVNTVEVLREVVHRQTIDFAGAMCLDSFQPEALAEAVKVYPGRPILNSISLEETAPGKIKLDVVMESVEGHDAVFIALCTGPSGPAATATDKLDLAEKIIQRAKERYNVGPHRLFVDVNVFPIGSENEPGMNFALETLEGVRLVKQKFPKVKTILGVGNLTNGLASKPYMRLVLTSVFVDEARKRGLDAAIINPNHYLFVSDLDPHHYQLALRIIFDHDMLAFEELETIAESKKGITKKQTPVYNDLDAETAITEKIKEGFKERESGTLTFQGHTYPYEDRIVLHLPEVLQRWAPLDFVNDRLMAAMQELGDGFARGDVSLPHLLRSADMMRQVMGFIERYLTNHSDTPTSSEKRYKGIVVLGTVYQDVHSIGKDLARTLLENYGYKVIDLGVMTPLQKFIDTAITHKANAIGMSALLVQTSNHMITVSRMLEEQGMEALPVLIGGAPVSDRHAAYVALAGHDDIERMRGNVFYCRTAMDGVNIMNQLMQLKDPAAFYEDNRRKLIRKFKQAQKRQEVEAGLLASLPRRTIRFDGIHRDTRLCFRHQVYRFDLKDFANHLDKHTLFSLNWRFGAQTAGEHVTQTQAEMETLFQQWIQKASIERWIQPQGIIGLYPCCSEGEQVILFDPDDLTQEIAQLTFTTVIGAGNEDLVSGADYFIPRQKKEYDVIGLQLTTAGAQVESVIESFKRKDDFESALLLQGLSDRIAEDMAEYLHGVLRKSIGVPPDCGQRWSPGYPGMKDITQNKIIYQLLHAGELLGIKITDAGEFQPTGTTAAAVSFHTQARYT